MTVLSDFRLGDHVLFGPGHNFLGLGCGDRPWIYKVTEVTPANPAMYREASVSLARRPLREKRALKMFLQEDMIDPEQVQIVSPWIFLAARLPLTVRVVPRPDGRSALEVACGKFTNGAVRYALVATLDAGGHAAFRFAGEAQAALALRQWVRKAKWEFEESDNGKRVDVTVKFTALRSINVSAYGYAVDVWNRAASGHSALALARAMREALEQVEEAHASEAAMLGPSPTPRTRKKRGKPMNLKLMDLKVGDLVCAHPSSPLAGPTLTVADIGTLTGPAGVMLAALGCQPMWRPAADVALLMVVQPWTLLLELLPDALRHFTDQDGVSLLQAAQGSPVVPGLHVADQSAPTRWVTAAHITAEGEAVFSEAGSAAVEWALRRRAAFFGWTVGVYADSGEQEEKRSAHLVFQSVSGITFIAPGLAWGSSGGGLALARAFLLALEENTGVRSRLLDQGEEIA